MSARLILKEIGSRINNIGIIVDTDPIIDCGTIRGDSDLSSASKEIQYLKTDEFTCSTGTFTEKITAPNITSLEQRVAALESKV